MKTLSHSEFKAEMFTDEHGPLVTLTQCDGYTEPMTVTMHPWQLKTMLEQFGVIAADKESAKTIATLERRLLLLRDRTDSLHSHMTRHSDHKHADLSYEMTYLSATLDIADEFCHGLQEVPKPALAMSAECSPAPSNCGSSKQTAIDFLDDVCAEHYPDQ